MQHDDRNGEDQDVTPTEPWSWDEKLDGVRAELRTVRVSIGAIRGELQREREEDHRALRDLADAVAKTHQASVELGRRLESLRLEIHNALADRDALVAVALGKQGAEISRSSTRGVALAALPDATAIAALAALVWTGTIPLSAAGPLILAVLAGRLVPTRHGGALASLLPARRKSDPPGDSP